MFQSPAARPCSVSTFLPGLQHRDARHLGYDNAANPFKDWNQISFRIARAIPLRQQAGRRRFGRTAKQQFVVSHSRVRRSHHADVPGNRARGARRSSAGGFGSGLNYGSCKTRSEKFRSTFATTRATARHQVLAAVPTEDLARTWGWMIRSHPTARNGRQSDGSGLMEIVDYGDGSIRCPRRAGREVTREVIRCFFRRATTIVPTTIPSSFFSAVHPHL